uniref:Regulator of G protein signaling like 1 n=1 Tax=Nothoprocta perdicaria TaxID=30464 RepID=A0A8C6ZWC2_NOTPE
MRTAAEIGDLRLRNWLALIALNKDDVFVDFFNTFLNLPIFGQTPIYISGTGQWDLWPELPSYLVRRYPLPGLLAWLEKHRLPHFCRSSLCLHFVLCQKLLGFVRSEEAAKLLNWQSADQWLLEKCISGSRGMWRFRAFVQGLAGEELTKFWLMTERILGLDKSNATQRKLYLSLLHALKATHLREGSKVLTLCRTPIGKKHQSHTGRETLSKMQTLALLKIQNYWLPNFFIHCKLSMEKEESCWPLLQEYRERLQADSQEPTGSFNELFIMHIKKSQASSGPYCSKKAKEEIWTLTKEERGTQEVFLRPGRKLISQQSDHASNTTFGVHRGEISPKRFCPTTEYFLQLEELGEEQLLSNMCFSTPVVRLPSLLALKRPVKASSSLSFLAWTLSAEACAGQPFREFLKRRKRSVEVCLLDLWHDLEDFLCVVLGCSGEGSFLLRHLIGVRIRKTYLDKGSVQPLPLEMRTLRNLQDRLPSGEVTPWIFKAQEEICKVLKFFYDEFLAEDDETFLRFMSPQNSFLMRKTQEHTAGKDGHILLVKRINESLKLSQALYGMRDLENLSSEHWQLVATQDLRKGGSIQVELEPPVCRIDFQKMTLDELAVKNPLLAMDLLSENYKLFCLKFPSLAFHLKHGKKRIFPVSRTKVNAPKTTVVVLEKPTVRPRHFMEVLRNPAHLEFFRSFLKENNTDGPLRFWLAVEKLVAETNPQKQRILIKNTVKLYFHAKTPAGMHPTSCALLCSCWGPFFPERDSGTCQSSLPCPMEYTLCASPQRKAWEAIRSCVKSICKFRRDIKNDRIREEFEDFLRKEVRNRKESMSRLLPPHSDKDMILVKRRLFKNRLITVNFLVNDLHFYLEIDNKHQNQAVAFLKNKVTIISNVFLDSDIPPKLRVRSWDPPRKSGGCSLFIAQKHCRAAASRRGERGTGQRFESALVTHTLKIQDVL